MFACILVQLPVYEVAWTGGVWTGKVKGYRDAYTVDVPDLSGAQPQLAGEGRSLS